MGMGRGEKQQYIVLNRLKTISIPHFSSNFTPSTLLIVYAYHILVVKFYQKIGKFS